MILLAQDLVPSIFDKGFAVGVAIVLLGLLGWVIRRTMTRTDSMTEALIAVGRNKGEEMARVYTTLGKLEVSVKDLRDNDIRHIEEDIKELTKKVERLEELYRGRVSA